MPCYELAGFRLCVVVCWFAVLCLLGLWLICVVGYNLWWIDFGCLSVLC